MSSPDPKEYAKQQARIVKYMPAASVPSTVRAFIPYEKACWARSLTAQASSGATATVLAARLGRGAPGRSQPRVDLGFRV